MTKCVLGKKKKEKDTWRKNCESDRFNFTAMTRPKSYVVNLIINILVALRQVI